MADNQFLTSYLEDLSNLLNIYTYKYLNLNPSPMPKIVDNYVLERRIGKGQFGEVFKGYNKKTGQDIAVKCVRRKSLTGKFTELL